MPGYLEFKGDQSLKRQMPLPWQLYQRLAVVLPSVQQPYKMSRNQINLML